MSTLQYLRGEFLLTCNMAAIGKNRKERFIMLTLCLILITWLKYSSNLPDWSSKYLQLSEEDLEWNFVLANLSRKLECSSKV